ncbi:MAG: hypothetical protein R3C15_13465 [Thermoleophilia bacterium]
MSATLPDDLERTLGELRTAVRRDHERRRQRATLVVLALLAAAVVTAGALVAAFETIGGDGGGGRPVGPGGADAPRQPPAQPPAPRATSSAEEEPADTPGVAGWTGDPTAAIGQFSIFARSSIRPDEEPAAVRAAFPGAASFPRGLPYRVIGPEGQGLRQVVAVAHADGYCVGDRLGGAECGVPLALGDTALVVLGINTRAPDGSSAVLSGLVSDAVVAVDVELDGAWRPLAVAENAYWGALRGPGVEALGQEQRLRLTLADERVVVLPDDLGAPLPRTETGPPAESVVAPPLEPAPGPTDAIEQIAAFARSAVRPDEEPAAVRAAFPGATGAPAGVPFRVLGPRQQGLRQVVAIAYEDGFCVGDRLGAWRCGVPLAIEGATLGLVGAISFTADGGTAVLSGLVSDAVTDVEVQLDGAWLPLAVEENAYWGEVRGRGIEGLAHEHRLRLTLADGRVVTVPDDDGGIAVAEAAVPAESATPPTPADDRPRFSGSIADVVASFPVFARSPEAGEVEAARVQLIDPSPERVLGELGRRVTAETSGIPAIYAAVMDAATDPARDRRLTETGDMCIGAEAVGATCDRVTVVPEDPAVAVAGPAILVHRTSAWLVAVVVSDRVVKAEAWIDGRWREIRIDGGVATLSGEGAGEDSIAYPPARYTLDDGRVVTSD